jgi:hypothetical protein
MRVPGPLLFALACSPVWAQESTAKPEPYEWSPLQNYPTLEGYGPLTLSSRSPFQMLRQVMTPRAPYPLREGQVMVTQTVTWTNQWSYKSQTYLLDGEILREGTYLSWGINDWLLMGFEMAIFHRSGGFADRFIEGFHDAIGIGQAQREVQPHDDFKIRLHKPDGTVAEFTQTRTISMEDTILFAQAALMTERRSWCTLAAGLQMKLPTGTATDLTQTRHIDGGGYLTAAKTLSREFVAYLSAGAAFFHPQTFGGINLVEEQWTAILALEYRMTEDFSILIQGLVISGAAENFDEFSEPSFEVTLGFKAKMTRYTAIEFGLLENLVFYENSPDFGVHLGITMVR